VFLIDFWIITENKLRPKKSFMNLVIIFTNEHSFGSLNTVVRNQYLNVGYKRTTPLAT